MRVLPSGGYTPTVAVNVVINTSPNGGAIAQAIEDTPPAGWGPATGIDNGGVWDSQNNKVKWGPWFDATPRALHYTVTPPAGETGTKTFTGLFSVDGIDITITGDQNMSPAAGAPIR
jgi:hypothetical protein